MTPSIGARREATAANTGAAFHPASEPVPLLVLAMVFFGYRSIGQIGALVRERSDMIALSASQSALTLLGSQFEGRQAPVWQIEPWGHTLRVLSSPVAKRQLLCSSQTSAQTGLPVP